MQFSPSVVARIARIEVDCNLGPPASGFEFRIVILQDWLPTKAKQPNIPYLIFYFKSKVNTNNLGQNLNPAL